MAEKNKKRVRFGLKNAHYAKWDESTQKYLAPKPIPGSVSMTLSVEGDSSTKYADDIPYFTTYSNGGYSGTLEVVDIPDEMLTDLWGYVKDANGMYVEVADATPTPFALLYEIGSNTEPGRFVFYNCTASRPSGDRNTQAESIDPDDESIEFTAIAKEFAYGDEKINTVKAYIPLTTETKTAYDKFFTEVQVPTKVAA